MAASSERLRIGFRGASQDAAGATANSSSTTSSYAAPDQILIPRVSGHVVSLSTCTKITAISFVVGVVVGFTLKKRLRRWAAGLLKRIKDD